jgi:hypothetical protein
VEIDGVMPEKDQVPDTDDPTLGELANELQRNLQLEPRPEWKAKLKDRLLDAYDWQFNK